MKHTVIGAYHNVLPVIRHGTGKDTYVLYTLQTTDIHFLIRVGVKRNGIPYIGHLFDRGLCRNKPCFQGNIYYESSASIVNI